jgi:hypothetical protein
MTPEMTTFFLLSAYKRISRKKLPVFYTIYFLENTTKNKTLPVLLCEKIPNIHILTDAFDCLTVIQFHFVFYNEGPSNNACINGRSPLIAA